MTLLRPGVFRLFAGLAACIAVYHLIGAFGGLPNNPSSPTRHAVFVAINLVCVWYALRRPLLPLPAFAALAVRQTMSHGGRALRMWHEAGGIDVVSILVLTAIYLALVLLILDARDRSPFVRRLVCPFSTAR